MRATTICATLTALLLLGSLPASAASGTAAFDRAMAPVVGAYEKIHQALARDTTDGVAAAAKKIAKLAPKLDARKVQGEHAAHFAPLRPKIAAAALKLSKAGTLAAQRQAFMELSRPLAMWATMAKPAGINVVYCSMAKASWLQRGKQIANPYYGAQMPSCGEVVSGEYKGTTGGHMKRGG